MPCVVRNANAEDAEQLADIYAHYVIHTPITFEIAAPTTDDFAARISQTGDYPWLVATVDDLCVGYAYACRHRPRAAYRYSVETSVYISHEHHRQGVGRQLYAELVGRLPTLGFCNAYAGVTLPNDASVGLHTRFGFRQIGVFPSVGYKFDQWHDVAWFHKPLRTQV